MKWIEIYPCHKNRDEAILKEVIHQNVLDVGSEDMDGNRSLSLLLEKTAKSVTRIDITKGQNFEVYDAGRRFDCIVAGEILEHLNNVGLFLDNCRKHLNGNGKLIITTPNPYSLERILHHFIFGKFKADASENLAEHTCMFTFELLERLLKRYGFVVDGKWFVNHEKYKKARIARYRNTLLVVARLKPDLVLLFDGS